MSAPGRGGGGGRLTDRKPRTASSRRWLERQINDPYVAEAKRRGYRSRAAFKLVEIDDRFRLLKAGLRVVDLGAAPGGWTQVAVARVAADRPGGGRVIAVDIAEVSAIAGAEILRADMLDAETAVRLRATLAGGADVVLSDMAPPSSGHASADHLRIIGLAEAALQFATEVLAPGGAFVCKVWQGGAEGSLLTAMKRQFRNVRHAKPPASRPESAELYVVASGFRARADAPAP